MSWLSCLGFLDQSLSAIMFPSSKSLIETYIKANNQNGSQPHSSGRPKETTFETVSEPHPFELLFAFAITISIQKKCNIGKMVGLTAEETIL